MTIKYTCPLGSTCKKTDTEGNVIERCRWLLGVKGQNPQTGEMEDKEECSITYLPIMQMQSIVSTNGVQAATESFRNEMVQANRESNKVLKSIAFSNQPVLNLTNGDLKVVNPS